MANYYVLLTDHGKSFIANAQAGSQLALTHVVLGDAHGQPYLPESRLTETKLVHQTAKLPVASIKVINETTAEVSAVVPSNVGGWNLHEVGITDSSGKLVYVGNFHGGYRPTLTEGAGGDMELVFTITADNLATVVIEMDGNVVSATRDWVNERFQLLLRTLIPYGYLYHTHTAVNPKPLFDELLGTDTQWRRIEGQTIVATDPDDTYIRDIGIVLGQKGMTSLANAQRPNVYPLRTTHIFERYDPSTVVETVWKVTANKTSINEGDAVRFTITANNLPDGQILNWSVKEGKLNSANNDITSLDKTDSGTVTLNNGQAIINFTTTSDDNEAEPQKHVRLTIGAPANLSINVPVNDAGHNETVMHISQSTIEGIDLAEYYKAQFGSYPSTTDTVRFIVDAGVDIIAPNTATPAITEGVNWPTGANEPIIENRGRILGRGGDGGRSAYWYGTNPTPETSVPFTVVPAQVGGNGGTAVKGDFVIDNYGLIAGGGGGGGGMGAWKTEVGDQNFGGGGGTGGGAPYGKCSLNEGTYPMYLTDETMPDYKPPTPTDGKTYQSLTIFKHAYNFTAGDGYDTYFDGGINGDSRAYATKNSQVRYVAFIQWVNEANGVYEVVNDGYTYSNMRMPKDASIDVGGQFGYGGGYALFMFHYKVSHGRDPSKNHGGMGGNIGLSGQAGVITEFLNNTGGIVSESSLAVNSPSASGGLAGFIKEGNVTINNLSGGVTKGR